MNKAQIIETLDKLYDYFENRADADHDGDGFVGNEEMKLMQEVEAITDALQKAPF